MERALTCLNEIVNEGIVGQYAIGGAIGASFYIEAVNTEDIDAFVFMTPGPGGIITLGPIYEALKAKGGAVKGEHIVIDNWPIQVLPAYKPLVEEALRESVSTSFNTVPTRVFSSEHPCAIALATGRPKDYLRVSTFIEQDQVDKGKLWRIVKAYGLEDKLANVANWNHQEGTTDGQFC
jgi:hypothetical protein